MQKRFYVFCLIVALVGSVSQSFAQRGRSEIAVGYGYWSIYSLVNGAPFNQSSGTPAMTYRYYLTKDVTLGLGLGYESIQNKGNYTTIAPEVTFCYLDTRYAPVRVRLYGSFSYGVTIFNNTNVPVDQADNSGVWAYGFNACPFGIRVGRQFAAFAEVGVGYKGLIHGGLELRVPRVLAKNRHRED